MRIRTRAARGALLLALLPGLWLAASLAPPIATRGEAREGLVVRSLVRDGDWVLPRREGGVPSKPPLFHWIAAGLAGTAGLSDTVVRAPSVLAAWVLVVATFVLGAELGGERTGWLAAGALLGMAGFWRSALEARVDMVFAACTTLSILGGILWYRRGGRWARVLCHLAAAAAVLAKGPAGAVLPIAILGTWAVVRRRPSPYGRLLSVPLAALAASLALLWYGLAWRDGGRTFVETQLLHENLHRLVGTARFAAQRGHRPFKLVLGFALQLLPWNLALADVVARWRRGERPDGAELALHAWWAVTLILFSVAAGKRNVYLLPLYPAIAVLAARALAARVPPARALACALAIAMLDVGMASATVALRIRAYGRDPLVPIARALARDVPRDAVLAAAWGVSENDRLVLAYRLDRPLPRQRRDTTFDYLLVPDPGSRLALRMPGAGRVVDAAPRRPPRTPDVLPGDS